MAECHNGSDRAHCRRAIVTIEAHLHASEVVKRVLTIATLFVALASLVACGSSATTSGSPSSPATTVASQLSATPPGLAFETASNLNDIQVPVPDGWRMSWIQDLVTLSPPDGTKGGFELGYFSGPLSSADVNCGTETPSSVAGPTTLAEHATSYEFYCPPVGADKGSWIALLPSTQGTLTWRWDYLGATGLGSGDYAEEFMAVLQAFSAPNLNPKPTPSGS